MFSPTSYDERRLLEESPRVMDERIFPVAVTVASYPPAPNPKDMILAHKQDRTTP